LPSSNFYATTDVPPPAKKTTKAKKKATKKEAEISKEVDDTVGAETGNVVTIGELVVIL